MIKLRADPTSNWYHGVKKGLTEKGYIIYSELIQRRKRGDVHNLEQILLI
jgi:hypothetical protein